MAGSGTSLFTDPADYEKSIAFMRRVLPIAGGQFRARCTWIELPHIQLFRVSETVERIGCLSLPPNRLYLMFSTWSGRPLLHGGVELRRGEFVLHAPGQCFYQRVPSDSRWGSISITPQSLGHYAEILIGARMEPPPFSSLFRPPAGDRERLLRLHAQACRITETRLTNIGHPEVSRALEQDLIWSLVSCLGAGPVSALCAEREATEAVVRFVEALAVADPPVTVQDLCRSIQVPERRLRAAFTTVLGLSPGSYLRLRYPRQSSRGEPDRARHVL
ncbi:MAG: hypothetical protein J0H14_04020 [Alphaproteobacteria bacterium]|nr:hypothetical protein [Alphaproteobacteria bacterium]